MKEPARILVFQTAFLGDVILTLPMIQLLHARYPSAEIDVVTTPNAAEFLMNHPAISNIIKYDKRKVQKGLKGIAAMSVFLSKRNYDLAVVPHRSFRTSMIITLSGIKERIGFSTASVAFLYNHVVRYEKNFHEIDRNISLLQPLGIQNPDRELPRLYPSKTDKEYINKFLFERELLNQERMIAIAPGSVWNTKRWPAERYAQSAVMLAEAGFELLIVGGKEDEELGAAIVETAKHKHIYNAVGKLSLLQSAELIGRCNVLITNDSAPLHIAVAMRTPVAAIFGATVPAFGFGPYGDHDIVIETKDLKCRPCAIHGGKECPIGTFVCMKNIEAEMVYQKVLRMITSL
ncbi:MAG: lipopolysaccharide heptosyltransferase II [Bacteroidota bacterium]